MSQNVHDLLSTLAMAEQELRLSRERETLLQNELAHRVRNVIAIIRSIFSRTSETAPNPEHALDHFQGRLDALARYHGASAGLPRSGFNLETMICDELLVFAATEDPRIEIDGPDLLLDHGPAELMGLALHELVTNSVKFGVLADSDPRTLIKIVWLVEGGALHFEWSETGVAVLNSAPLPRGFGQEFIEQALPYQLGATTEFSILPGGIRCRIRFELNGSAYPVDQNS